jgi:hypothetical protein
MPAGPARDALAIRLDARMAPGSIDANIMVKLDRWTRPSRIRPTRTATPWRRCAATPAATSSSGLVLSAGINQRLFTY